MAQRPEWISVNFTLPKNDTRCVVTRRLGEFQYAAEFDVFYTGQGWMKSLGGAQGEVTHWMEAPEPPIIK